jgi:hypothetical protein
MQVGIYLMRSCPITGAGTVSASSARKRFILLLSRALSQAQFQFPIDDASSIRVFRRRLVDRFVRDPVNDSLPPVVGNRLQVCVLSISAKLLRRSRIFRSFFRRNSSSASDRYWATVGRSSRSAARNFARIWAVHLFVSSRLAVARLACSVAFA